MARYVMGDIHGGFKALEQVFERSEFDFEKDQLIQLGDVVDRWPDSAECIDLLLKVKNLIAIRGNHDQWCNEWLNKGTINIAWRDQGGKSTMESLNKWAADGKSLDEFRRFFRYQEDYYIDDHNNLFVHGGFTHVRGVESEHMRSYLYWDRSLIELAMSAKKGVENGTSNMPARLKNYNEIFIGHTTTMIWNSIDPIHACNVWNLDTGCGFKGPLTIMDVDTKQYWQSDPILNLYK